ncbi:hypothetical protein KIF59_10485 [Enterobacter cloacae subsp. cloacae]|nr:hypothetical protein [Enterobacter cloacae subsp. cloacae]
MGASVAIGVASAINSARGKDNHQLLASSPMSKGIRLREGGSKKTVEQEGDCVKAG